MALTLPEFIPSKASQGEKRLFEILKTKLPDDFIVWHEPRLQNELKPDITILGPTFGLLIIEVKGWYSHEIEEAGEFYFKVRQKEGHLESRQSPLRQAHGYFCSAADRFKGYSVLRQQCGNYEGRLAFPIGVGAVMSNITEPQAHEEHIDRFLERPYVAYRDELLAWKDFTPGQLVQRLQEMFKINFSFPPLTADQISTIKGCLHPETIIKEVAATAESVPEGFDLSEDSKVVIGLDLDQERLARSLKDGHRLVSGVAGSGKTLILLARAKALANRLLDQRILILCFNITLAAHLRSLLHGDEMNPQYKERIQVMHFHDWAKSLMGKLPSYQAFPSEEACNVYLGQQVLAALQQLPPEQRWDSVLVDEAHTFTRDWFLCCVAALKDPENGDLLVVSDGNQGLYKRSKFTWKSVGVKAAGRSLKLSRNYRNTQEILEAAWSVIQSSSGSDELAEDNTFPTVTPAAALRCGPRPVLHLASTKAAAVEAALGQVGSLCAAGHSPADIAILYRYKRHPEAAQFQALLQGLQALGTPAYWVTESQQTKTSYSARRPGVRVITTLSSLGLEFKAVLLLWVEQFADCFDTDLEARSLARRQLYVAMTRAQDELHLFAGGRAQVIHSLGLSSAIDVQPAQFSRAKSGIAGL